MTRNQTKIYDQNLTLQSNVPTRIGYTFVNGQQIRMEQELLISQVVNILTIETVMVELLLYMQYGHHGNTL